MTSDRSRRVRRCSWWGFGAVLAAAAGASAQQSNSSTTTTYQPGNQTGMSQQTWSSADYIPQLANGTVVLSKEDGSNKTTQVTIQDGRVTSAEIDGQYVPPERVQVQGNKIRVLDENNQVASTLKIPRLSGTAMRSAPNRQYGANDRYYDNRADNRYQDSRYSDRAYDRQNDPYPQDRFSRDFDRDDWRLRDQGQYSRDYYRDQDRYTRQDYPRQDYDRRDYNRDGMSTYQPDRYNDNRFNDSRPGSYDSRYDPRYNRQGYNTRDDRFQGGRVYGTTESGRPAMALGIMTSDAATTDLNTTSTGTKYTQGIKIEQIQDGMPGATSGLQKGDIIVAIDGRMPATVTLLHQEIASKDAGDTLQLRVLRSGTEQTVPVKLERIDYSKYNWDFMQHPTTVDQGLDTVDQQLLQPNNKQEIYRPSDDRTRDNGPPLWDRMRDRVNNPR